MNWGDIDDDDVSMPTLPDELLALTVESNEIEEKKPEAPTHEQPRKKNDSKKNFNKDYRRRSNSKGNQNNEVEFPKSPPYLAYLSNLPSDCAEKDIKELFGEKFNISKSDEPPIRLIRHRNTTKHES